MDEYTCPKCGAILNNQKGFDPEYGTWRCLRCGQMIMDEDTYNGDLYKGVAWYCDECGALLNKQDGFSDTYYSWNCTECGHENFINEDEIDDEDHENTDNYYLDDKDDINDEEEFDDDDDTDDVDNEIVALASDAVSSMITSALEIGAETYKKVHSEKKKTADMLEKINEEEARIESEKSRAWRRKHKKGILITVITILLILIAIGAYIFYITLIPVRYDSEDLIGTNYESVETKLRASGFENVNSKEIPDLKITQKEKENVVTDVIIRNKMKFSAETKFLPSEKITVVYHTLEKIYAPLTSKEAKGMQYADVVKQFEEKGFQNVKVEPIYDIITGWIKKDGEVESVSINGSKDFTVNTSYNVDAEVIINYHTLKKNREN